MSRTHLEVTSGAAACGAERTWNSRPRVRSQDLDLTEDPDKVTCLRCRRSAAFAMADRVVLYFDPPYFG